MGSNVRRWDEEEDSLLRTYNDMGLTVAQTAEALDRPFGSVATRRRTLGLSKDCGTRGPNAKQCFEMTEEEAAADTFGAEVPEMEPEVYELLTMRKYVVYFYGACLFAAGLLAFLGDV